MLNYLLTGCLVKTQETVQSENGQGNKAISQGVRDNRSSIYQFFQILPQEKHDESQIWRTWRPFNRTLTPNPVNKAHFRCTAFSFAFFRKTVFFGQFLFTPRVLALVFENVLQIMRICIFSVIKYLYVSMLYNYHFSAISSNPILLLL